MSPPCNSRGKPVLAVSAWPHLIYYQAYLDSLCPPARLGFVEGATCCSW